MCIVGITRTLMLNLKIHKTSAVFGRITLTSNINSLTRAIVISVLNISFKFISKSETQTGRATTLPRIFFFLGPVRSLLAKV